MRIAGVMRDAGAVVLHRESVAGGDVAVPQRRGMEGPGPDRVRLQLPACVPRRGSAFVVGVGPTDRPQLGPRLHHHRVGHDIPGFRRRPVGQPGRCGHRAGREADSDVPTARDPRSTGGHLQIYYGPRPEEGSTQNCSTAPHLPPEDANYIACFPQWSSEEEKFAWFHKYRVEEVRTYDPTTGVNPPGHPNPSGEPMMRTLYDYGENDAKWR